MKNKGLGRGLDALLADNSTDNIPNGITVLRLLDIEPNKAQARKTFDPEAMEELASSIAQHGLISPVIVRKKTNGFYEIIAGERRWRASKMAGLSEIPAIIRDTDDQTSCLLSLIENLQRRDLNPVEEARGYRDLMESFDLTQEEAAKRVGKSRVAVANLLRILNLPEYILSLVIDGSLTYGHARALLPLTARDDKSVLTDTARLIISKQLSVRETERLVKGICENSAHSEKAPNASEQEYYKQLENRIGNAVGRRAYIKTEKDGSGKIAFAYSGTDDLETLIKSFCGTSFFEENQ